MNDKTECTCCRCGAPLAGKLSYDLWVSITRYDDAGEPVKTLMEPDVGDITDDYFIIGMECCGHLVAPLWNDMIQRVGGTRHGG